MLSGRITILALADDDALRARLDGELGAVAALRLARSADDALEILASEPADVLILPERVRGASAVSIAARLRAAAPDAPIVVLAPVPEARDLTAAVRAQHVTDAIQDDWRAGELAQAALRALELGRLRRDLRDQRLETHRRIDALANLHEIAAATHDLGSYHEILREVTAAIFRILRFDLAAGLVVSEDGAGPVLHLHCQEPSGDEMLRDARDRCLRTFRSLTSRRVDEGQLAVHVSGNPPGDASPGPLGAATHVPLRVEGQIIGLLLVARRSGAFTPDDDRLLYFLAGHVSDAIRRLAARMHDERRRLGLMVESMADGLILTDRHSDEVLINPAARQMLGLEPDVPVTTGFLKDRLGFYPFDLLSTRSRSGDPPEPLREEVRIGDRRLHSMVSPVRDAGDELAGVVVVLRDFTHAVETARRQREFVSVVSHELRTPLTSITGALDIVLSEYAGSLAPKQRRYLHMARDASTRLNVTIDDILDASRSERERVPVQFAPIALDELGRDVAERYRGAAEAKTVSLQVRAEDSDIRLVADPDRLTQVLNNLLSNAVKFTPEQGEIEVEIFGPSVASSHVGVSVFNNGEPIPEDAREKVFESFEQLQDSDDRRVGGTGLGLAISRSIVEAHGGRIWVEARRDGTKFVFTLPSAPAESEAEDDAAEATAAPGPAEVSARILVVDDDRYSTYILKGILMAAGHEVSLASNADEALTLARTRGPALVVVNASMRSADGLALIEIFKHDPETRRTAILVHSDHQDRETALGTGADEFLAKPFEPQKLRAVCARLALEAGRARAHRVLAVDDDAAIRSICRDVLQNAGYAVREARTGAEAMAETRRFRPDLLLLDVMMPEMDGFETAEHLRAESATSMTPIIFLSARGETADKVRAFRIGAEDYIVKPFDAAELVARVGKALERRDRELSASPTTQLPGSGAIEAEIERRLADPVEYAFCYLDLDNLKAFNDYYGYAKADGVIRQTGDLVRDVVAREGSAGDFIGHIAGDDFVFITTAAAADAVCTTICATFDRLVPLYYNKDDRERGHIETKDRYGVLRRFPLMGVSLAAVTSRGSGIRTYSELASRAAEGKKLAKSLLGSSYVCDGDVVIGTVAPSGRGSDSDFEVA